jgi:AhpD family alkylhydroperoxidase
MTAFSDVIDDLREPTRTLRQAIPETWAGFAQLHQSAMSDGVLPAGLKEVIALAIAVVKQCDGCIAYHAKAAARRGATPEEVAEALGVALLMDGGTASVYGPRAWQAYREFAASLTHGDRESQPLDAPGLLLNQASTKQDSPA